MHFRVMGERMPHFEGSKDNISDRKRKKISYFLCQYTLGTQENVLP